MKKHGRALGRARIYKAWHGIYSRCFNSKYKAFPRYGGRGITMCKEWLDFEAFVRWSLANGYHDDLTIDRINNDLGYSPDNCRYIDYKTQTNNRRNTRFLTAFGEVKPFTTWLDDPRCKCPDRKNLENRIDVLKWEPERALSVPVRNYKHQEDVGADIAS